MAVDAIDEAIAKNDFSSEQLGKFSKEYLAGMESVRKLVYAFYKKDFSFARFLKKYPHHREDIVNILVGNVFRQPVNGLFERLGEFCELPKEQPLTMN